VRRVDPKPKAREYDEPTDVLRARSKHSVLGDDGGDDLRARVPIGPEPWGNPPEVGVGPLGDLGEAGAGFPSRTCWKHWARAWRERDPEGDGDGEDGDGKECERQFTTHALVLLRRQTVILVHACR